MSDSVPENVDLDERFNDVDPKLLQQVLVKNLTWSIGKLTIDAAKVAMPLILMEKFDLNPKPSDYKDVLTETMRALAIISDLIELIDKVIPVQDGNISAEQREEIKEKIFLHPIIVEAAFRIKESPKDKVDRKRREYRNAK